MSPTQTIAFLMALHELRKALKTDQLTDAQVQQTIDRLEVNQERTWKLYASHPNIPPCDRNQIIDQLADYLIETLNKYGMWDIFPDIYACSWSFIRVATEEHWEIIGNEKTGFFVLPINY